MSRLLLVLAIPLVSCAASIPLVDHEAKLQEQERAYEDRLRRSEDEHRRAAQTSADEKAAADRAKQTLDERVAQLESALADKQRTLDDVTTQLVELQEAFSKLSSKERSQIEAHLQREKQKQAAVTELQTRLATSLKEDVDQAKVEILSKDDAITLRFKDGALFQKGGSKLVQAAKATIDRLAGALKSSPDVAARIEAHTDSVRAQDGDTWSLTQQQGLAIVGALAKLGVDPSRLSYTSYGQFRPLQTNDTAEGRAANRRVELILSSSRTR